MPSGKVHVVAGAVTGSVVMYKLGAPADMIVASAFGGLLPDIDHKSSLLGRWNLFVSFFKHRGFTHSLLCWAVVTFIAAMFLNPYWTIGISVGYLSHLVLDFKIPWLWPRVNKQKRKRKKRKKKT